LQPKFLPNHGQSAAHRLDMHDGQQLFYPTLAVIGDVFPLASCAA
jgi:hypothetical protein